MQVFTEGSYRRSWARAETLQSDSNRASPTPVDSSSSSRHKHRRLFPSSFGNRVGSLQKKAGDQLLPCPLLPSAPST